MSVPKPTIDTTQHSQPIPIAASPFRGPRARSGSMSSLSSGSASSLEGVPATPLSGSGGISKGITAPSPGSSPILSYFLAQSPTKSPTFPFRNFTAPVQEAEEDDKLNEVPAAMHARRASTHAAGRFAQPQTTSLPDPHLERGTSLLRRLSLSTQMARPQFDAAGNTPSVPDAPPNSAVSPIAQTGTFPRDRPRRSATINIDGSNKPRRAPSPMGERMLKGHFDGFN